MNLKSIFFILSILTCATAYSQMMPMTTTIKTPYGNVNHTTYTSSPIYYGQQNISAKYQFRVVLNNDSSFVTRTRINISDKKHNSITVKKKGVKTEIFPKDTQYILRITPDNTVLKGIAADSCWLFKTVIGEIFGYSFLAEDSDLYLVAVQKGDDGPIVPLTKDNLMPLVIADQKAHELAEKGKLKRALTRYNDQVQLGKEKARSKK